MVDRPAVNSSAEMVDNAFFGRATDQLDHSVSLLEESMAILGSIFTDTTDMEKIVSLNLERSEHISIGEDQ